MAMGAAPLHCLLSGGKDLARPPHAALRIEHDDADERPVFRVSTRLGSVRRRFNAGQGYGLSVAHVLLILDLQRDRGKGHQAAVHWL